MRTLALCLACLAATACGDTVDYGGSSAPPAASCTAANATAVPAGGVVLANTAFVPACGKVPAGTTVRFTNGEPMQHTVTADSGSFDSGVLNQGQFFDATFAATGTVGIHCTLHPGMRMTLLVQ
jgi:plastocyanin